MVLAGSPLLKQPPDDAGYKLCHLRHRFLVSAEIINRQGGWKHHLLTEDIEFSIDNAIQGEKIGYCHEAMVYDEQPDTFRMSWRQRLRWAKGFYQVFGKYGKNLVSSAVKTAAFLPST